MNHTPERGNIVPKGIWANQTTIKACGWCKNSHIADTKCTCEEPCDKGWCAAKLDDEEPFYL